MNRLAFFFMILGLVFQSAFSATSYIHHGLDATVNPEKHYVSVTDTITFPEGTLPSKWQFLLNKELKVTASDPNIKITLLQSDVKAQDTGMDMEAPQVAARIKQNRYAIEFTHPVKAPVSFVLHYAGTIYNEVQSQSEEYERGFSTTPGIIGTQGIYLAGSSDWIPWFGNDLITFRLTARLPAGWDVVSQGKRTRHTLQSDGSVVSWLSNEPMEEVFLIAAKFHEYDKQVGKVKVMAFLREPDRGLADKYLVTTGEYLEMYRQLIGPYPYWKFALVENFWETGYGMPSFTLLGPQIIRFPFILHSSYPHELLHNWWGNSVYVDFKHGNWCEGLTVYMADHLIKEQRGQGDQYRRATLQKYTDYVNPQNDFPLAKFLSRHDAPTEAVGYGKCMMVWDMLREDVGDQTFIKAVQKFYHDNKFKRASFDDLRRAFEAVSGNDYKAFFKQWIERTGAPTLKMSDVSVHKTQDGRFRLNFKISQAQKEAPFDLSIPVAVLFADSVHFEKVHLNGRQATYSFTYQERPASVEADPQFHVFRRLHPNEIPPALSKIFGAKKILIVLPDKAGQDSPYMQLADIWSKNHSKDVQIKKASEVKKFPADRSVWILGKDNPFVSQLKTQIKDYDIKIGPKSVRLEKTTVVYPNNCIVVTARHPQNPSAVLVWLTIGNKAAVNGLARKLPHYGKYSYLAFTGDEPTNVAKGQWPVVHSPLSKVIPLPNGQMPEHYQRNLPKRPPLARVAPLFSARQMLKDIKYLSSDALQGRGLGTKGIEKAAKYIANQFSKAGLKPGADDGTFFQKWQDVVDASGRKGEVKNVIALLPGTNPKYAHQAVVVSAHYDHLGLGWPDVHKGDEGKIHHGADDNASGIAVMLELARVLAQTSPPQRTIIFVAFTGEENGLRGSQYFVSHYKRFPVKNIIADLNLDTVGRLHDQKVLILNSSSAREWPFIFMGSSYVTGVESEMVTQQLDASDQVSFIKAGVPAVQIFSGAHRDYHRPTDTWDKIDAQGLVKIASLTKEVLMYLANERKEPLTFKAQNENALKKRHAVKGQRHVSTGILPEFVFQGAGVKIKSIAPHSPAQKAGLKAGDVIVKVDGQPVKNLRDYSDILKTHNPGDTIIFIFNRNGKQEKTKIVLEAR